MSYSQPSSVTLCIPSPSETSSFEKRQTDRQTKVWRAGSVVQAERASRRSLALHIISLLVPLDAVRTCPADSRSADNSVMAPDLLRNIDIGVITAVV